MIFQKLLLTLVLPSMAIAAPPEDKKVPIPSPATAAVNQVNSTHAAQHKVAPPTAGPLVTSDLSAEKAAVRGKEVVRAVATSEPKVTERHGAHMSTREGDIRGGGMVTWASCRQAFTVTAVLAGGGRAGNLEVSYSFIERAIGFPLPHPERPVAKGDKVVLVLGVDGSPVRIFPDVDESRKEIETITEYIKTRPPAALSLLKATKSLTLKIEYHGPNGAAHPSVWCTTKPKIPDNLAPNWLVMQNLSDVWVYQAVDHLVKIGMLKPEAIRAERQRPRPKEPYYSLSLSADGVDEVTFYLGWGKEAYGRIEALGRAIQYDGGIIAKLLANLKATGMEE